MKKHNHYEEAFEAYMEFLGLPCLATLERHRTKMAENEEEPLKNFDFIISSSQICKPAVWKPENTDFTGTAEESCASPVPSTISWLVDVKGRKFPSGQKSPQYWRNWLASDDLNSLTRWECMFGMNFRGMFVFVFEVCAERLPLPEKRLFLWNGGRYAFFGVPLAIYREHSHPLSAQWKTVAMTKADFLKYAVPLDVFFGFWKH